MSVLNEELAAELDAELAALKAEYVPQFIALLKIVGIEVNNSGELRELLFDAAAFEAALPEGLTIETLPKAFDRTYSQLDAELADKVEQVVKKFEDHFARLIFS